MTSAIVLTHNDGKILSRCLASVLWCDEVIVVDDDSTDETVLIAKKQGAKVYVHPLNDDFAAQRNFGLSKAKGPARNASHSDAGGDWVLFVDSDEVVSEELATEIREKVHGKNAGYYVRRKDFFLGTWLTYGETAHVKFLRLAKKDSGRWQHPVHEVWMVQGAVGELKKPFLHFPHHNVAQFLEEINQYSSLNAQFLYRKNIGVRWWQIAAYPAAKFFLNYFWRLGFLDGTAGAVMAIMMSFHSFLVRAKLWQLRDRKA